MLRFSKIAFHVKLFFVKQIVPGQRNAFSLQQFFQQKGKSPKLKILIFRKFFLEEQVVVKKKAGFSQKQHQKLQFLG